jgi:hypothetical protein
LKGNTNEMKSFFGQSHNQQSNLKLENAAVVSGASLDVIII